MIKYPLNKKTLLLILAILGLLISQTAKAVCPVCTIAVTACVGLARWLKIDDSISGLWLGGLIVSLIIWTIDYLNKKNIRFGGRKPLVVIGYYVLIILPLYFSKIIGNPLNKCWGIDKLLFSIIIGSVLFAAGMILHNYLKKKNNKSYFPFQKVILPIVPLAVFSIIFYFLIR